MPPKNGLLTYLLIPTNSLYFILNNFIPLLSIYPEVITTRFSLTLSAWVCAEEGGTPAKGTLRRQGL